MDNLSLAIPGDVKVVVPSRWNLLSSFVLQEQQDWFEDEIHFIRRLITPGANVVDIGANYGVYALTMARLAGPQGKIWAFEPTEATSSFLRRSIKENEFENFELIQAGLSNRMGTAELYTAPNSELNSLSPGDVHDGDHETIQLSTLDQCCQQYSWSDIDFIKLDAEGEETNILDCAVQTLGEQSPLIMFELKHGKHLNLPLIEQFKQLGYQTYRLIPGLNVLVPAILQPPVDQYWLNLFCCKADRAAMLKDRSLLVESETQTFSPGDVASGDAAEQYIARLPYASLLADASGSEDPDYLSALNAYIVSMSQAETVTARVGCLMHSLDQARAAFATGESNLAKLATYSRIAFDAGERELGVRILTRMLEKYEQVSEPQVSGLFLPPTREFEAVDPHDRLHAWLRSAVLEQYITKFAYSCYFAAQRSLSLLEQLAKLGFLSEPMSCRLQLLRSCVRR